MSTNAGKTVGKGLLSAWKKKAKKSERKLAAEGSNRAVASSFKIPGENKPSNQKKAVEGKASDGKLKKADKAKLKSSCRFNEGQEDHVLRSPSRLGHLEDIPVIIEGAWDNVSQDSNQEDLNLDLKGLTEESEYQKISSRSGKRRSHLETKEFGQQTDFPVTPSSERKEDSRKQFVTSHKFFNEKLGHTPQHPFEKTVLYVKSPTGNITKCSDSYGVPEKAERPVSASHITKSDTGTRSNRIDSGYGSRPETIRIPGTPNKPLSGKSVTISEFGLESPVRTSTVHEGVKSSVHENKQASKSSNMSYYATEIYSPTSSARRQEKQDLQLLNDRFSHYIQRVRLLSEQSNRLDASSFIKQTRILEEEVANLKTLYERELDILRQELNAVSREKNNYQVQCDKNRQAAIDLETRLGVETDKSRRLTDNVNGLQKQIANLELEVMNLRSVGDGRTDFQSLQREMDKLIRENEDHKRRQEQEALLRAEAEDRCHTLVKKLEFNDEVHTQQVNELRERLEQSQATIIGLESRLNEASKNDSAIPDILKQVREQAEMELKRYQLESNETYSRNIAALKCQMDNDANTIERLQSEKSTLQGQIGELNAKIRNLEGQILTLEHQRDTVEELIRQERQRSSEQIQEMERKLRDMQELVFAKMQEASSARDLHLPLKAEIEAMKALLEEEEKRLQTPYIPSAVQPLTPTNTPLNLPSVTQSTGAHLAQSTQLPYTTQVTATTDSTFVTQSAAHNQYLEQSTQQQEPLFTHVPLPTVSEQGQFSNEFGGTTRYTYETTPSVNRLQINSPPRNSPRVVGPITRAKSAPVRHAPGVQLIPTNLGQGKDYFDEMFRDLTRETLYTQTRPKSSPQERPPSAARERPKSAVREKSPTKTELDDGRIPVTSAEEVVTSKVTTERPSSSAAVHDVTGGETQSLSRPDRPQSSVFHDYTTSTASAVGDVKILEVNQDGKFVRLVNDGKQEIEFGGYMIQQNVGGHPVAVFRFPPRTKFADNSTITVWSGTTEPIEHQPPKDFVWKEQQKWGTGPECTTILCKPNGQAVAWMTAAHRFTKNPYDDTATSIDDQVYETGNPVVPTQDEVLTEMNVNLNEPKPEPVYLRREKQTPPSLNAQKHPHGTSPGKDTHPHTGQPRPMTYGNDNTSLNRQSRIQSTRPDPIPGQPYAGSSANRIGSAPLRKYKTVSSGTIRGSGVIANRSAGQIRHGPPTPFLSPKQQEYSEFRDNKPLDPGVTTPPPNPFQSPHQRFETGLEQLQSQHHVDFLPPMPRPPLFSTW